MSKSISDSDGKSTELSESYLEVEFAEVIQEFYEKLKQDPEFIQEFYEKLKQDPEFKCCSCERLLRLRPNR